MPARIRTNGNVSDASLEQLQSVSIFVTVTCRPICFAKLFVAIFNFTSQTEEEILLGIKNKSIENIYQCVYKFYFIWTACKICDEPE